MKSVIAWIKRVISLVLERRHEFERVLNTVLDILPVAYDIVAIVAAITPSRLDDVTLVTVRASFPKLFDETLTVEERKLYLLAVATELLKGKFPGISTSTARLAVQLAYVAGKHNVQISAQEVSRP